MLKRMLASAIVLAMVAVTHCEAGLVFNESFGTGVNTTVVAHAAANGFDNSGTLTFGGNAFISNDQTSLGGYTDASGGLNGYITANKAFSITGINLAASGTSAFNLNFGFHGVGNYSDLGLEYSLDGITWTAASYSVDAGLETQDDWQLATATLNNAGFLGASSAGLRWANSGPSTSYFRIDDINLRAVPEPSALLLVGLTVGAGVLRRRRA